MRSKNLQTGVIRLLHGRRELPGYSIYKLLVMKGMKAWPNNIYTLLGEMEKNGLLKSRWTDKRKSASPRKHLYSLSQSGKREYDKLVEDSLNIVIERFFEENLALEDMPFHIRLAQEAFGSTAGWSENEAFTFVIASPSYDPLVCFPKYYYVASEAYPNSAIYVVKNPWGKPLEGRRNLTFLDGSRDDIPLRDNFADYVLLQGFPTSSSVADTVNECLRVLKEGGCLFVWLPAIMTMERRVPYLSDLPDYVLRLFYELCGQDRSVSIEEVKKMLSLRFKHVKNLEIGEKIMFYAAQKRARDLEDAPLQKRRNLRVGREEPAKL